jgi:hypothetical protein
VVSISGTGFAAGLAIAISFANTSVVTSPGGIQTDSLGSFSGTFVVPQMPPGPWSVLAKDSAGSNKDAIYTIARKMSLSATTGYVGTNVTIRGTDFAPLSSVTVTFDSSIMPTIPVSIMTDNQGRFIGNFTVPDASSGYHPLIANDSTGGAVSFSFYVYADIELNPIRGNNGTSVVVTGLGFGPNTLVNITFDSLPVATTPASVQTNSNGTFSALFAVDSNVPGSHTIRATDLFGNTNTATFTVIRQVTSSSSNVNVLQAITLTGVGFDAYSTINLTWDGSPISTLRAVLTTDAQGGFVAMITVPLSPYGPHSIVATDGNYNAASVNVTIVPSITLLPTGQIVGDQLWIRGDGFASLTQIMVAWDGALVATDPTTLTTDSNGSFITSFTIPPCYFGSHRVTVSDQLGHSAQSSYSITLSSALNVVIDVGSIYFPGEVAEFYVLSAQSGKPFNATSVTVKLFGPGGSWEDLSPLITLIETGVYRLDYTLPGNSSPGSYALVANVSKDFSGVTYYGSDLRVFEVSGTFEQMNATLVGINDTLASISLDIGPVLLRLDQVNASLASLISNARGDILAAISTTSGTIVSRLDLLNVNLSSISNGIATISSSLGTIQVNLTAIGAKVTSMEGTVANISTVLGGINASITDLNPRLAAIQDGVILMHTDLGDVQLALDDLQVRSITIEGALVRIETGVGTIISAMENLTGIAIPIETASGTFLATLFTNTRLTSAEYVPSTQSINIACESGGSQSSALSLVLPKAALDQLNASPAALKLMVNSKESLFTLINASSAYIVQTNVEEGRQEAVLYLNGLPSPFTSLTLLASALAALLVVGVVYAWVRWRKTLGAVIPRP